MTDLLSRGTRLSILFVGFGRRLKQLVRKHSLRTIPASFSMVFSCQPAGPTKGKRWRSSCSPQASPTIAILYFIFYASLYPLLEEHNLRECLLRRTCIHGEWPSTLSR